MKWYNEPPAWRTDGDAVTVTCGAKTDFWRKTHYGFIRDNGHFYFKEVEGDFVAEVKVSGEYQALYDQAGLMLRADEENWLKCGIEFVEGVQHLSVVVTHDFSDWSVAPLPENPPSIWLRVTRKAEAVEVEYSLDGASYTLARVTYMGEAPRMQVGVMCASPEGNGFLTSFEGFAVRNA